jgi:hypothetical protein
MSKYKSIPTTLDGIRFASKREASHYATLKLMQQAGAISDLKIQPRFPIEVNGVKICTYVADFEYYEKGQRFVVDVKGVKTAVYRMKRLLMWAVHGIEITEV